MPIGELLSHRVQKLNTFQGIFSLLITQTLHIGIYIYIYISCNNLKKSSTANQRRFGPVSMSSNPSSNLPVSPGAYVDHRLYVCMYSPGHAIG